MKPPPVTASVAGPVTPILAPASQAEEPQAGVTPGAAEEDVSMAAVTPFSDEVEEGEPTAKRQKLSTRRVDNEELCRMDVELHEHLDRQADADIFDSWLVDDDEISGLDDDDFSGMMQGEVSENSNAEAVWGPYSEMQPELPADELHLVDLEADKMEIQHLLSMSVVTSTEKYDGELDVPLHAKMVCRWRKRVKSVAEGTMWMRRSRLVGRDFNFLEYREDVYSPASSSSVVKLLPRMAVSGGFVKDGVLATLDVVDAFLQVPQSFPRKISLEGSAYVILKCLPGQRDASRLWYAFFVEGLRSHVSVEVCPGQPRILRCGNDGVLLLHVDDVLICGSEDWIGGTLISEPSEGVQTHLHNGEEAGWWCIGVFETKSFD